MQLRVMSFNIRYGMADDGDHDWSHRCSLVRDTIAQFAPDLLGTQEALSFQVDYLQTTLGQFEIVGVGREDGRQAGECVAVFFRAGRFTLVNAGHFWLSETPKIPGTKGWDASQPRMVTWCQLRDTFDPQKPLFLFNTHFDLRGAVARHESAKLLRRHAERVGVDARVIITGDFNCTEDGPEYAILVRGEMGLGATFVDAYRAIHPRRMPDELSRHGFQPHLAGSRIDWILHSHTLTAVEAHIVRTNFDGHFPSDHYPVTAVLQCSHPPSH